MKKIYLIDALNFLFRSYYAIGPMTNSKGQSTNALFGFIRSILKIIKDFSPTHMAIIFDGPDNKKLRKELYEDYKSHRKSMPDDLFTQMDWAIDFCKYANIPTLIIPEVEADDTIGSIAKWAYKNGVETYILSGDKDLCQLVNDKTFVINAHKDNLLIDEKKVEEIFGVRTDQLVDYLAIMGDASDNIPGIEGFGPKTASDLLKEFETLENILANPDKVSGKKKQEVLKTSKDIAILSKKLATINTDVNFPKEETFFELHPPKFSELTAFYQEMHFNSLLKDLEEPPKKNLIEEKISYKTIHDEKALKEVLHTLAHHKHICIDTETTTLPPMDAMLVGVGLGVHPHEAYYIPFNGSLDPKIAKAYLKQFIENSLLSFYGHNIKYDMHVLQNEGIFLKNVYFDTMLASYVLQPHQQRHNLDDLCLEKFGKIKIPITDLIGKGKKEISMSDVPIDKVSEYCCEDVDYTCQLKNLFEPEIKQEKLETLFETIEIPLVPILLDMERTGMFVDIKELSHLSKEITLSLKKLEESIYSFAEEEFNINSPKQLSHILFDKLQLKPPKKTITGFSTSAEVLELLKDSSPIIEKILDYRGLEKLRSTYIDALPEQINKKTGRIHCTFNQSGTATGRLSCQNPNLQNIPVRSEEGKKIRSAFRPENPDWSFLSSDYSQIELRLLAHFSEDPHLVKAFQEGEDIHAFTASEVFNIPLSDVTPQMRHQAKAVNFGILYGQQAFGLSRGLSIEYAEASRFIDAYFKRYKRVKEFLESCKETARKTGKATTITGRQRPIPEINNKNPMIRSAAERLAVNTPLQGTAADLIKLAMIAIDSKLKNDKALGHMILQIHDELLFEVPDEKISVLSPIVKTIMETIMTLKVPLTVTISIGKNWGEC